MEKLEALLESDTAIHNAKNEKERNSAIRAVTGYKDKTGVSSDWASKNRTLLDDTLDALQRVGVFVVPNGTLESWAPDVSPKVRFAELAPDEIRTNPDLRQKLDTFLEKVLLYLDIKIKLVVKTIAMTYSLTGDSSHETYAARQGERSAGA